MIFLLSFAHVSKAGNDKLVANIADEICKCLTSTHDSIIKNTEYTTCVVEKVSPFKKAIMKILRKSMKEAMNEDSFSDQEIENFNKKLDAALYKTCPNKAKAFIDIVDLLSDE
ncbi:MAG TPA: hypothetical protein PKO18_06265 [Chitinophagales bacterium]|nr:hypothetical protein [Chitinophagales bacterium]